MSRILIADDQNDVLEALRILLKGEGHQTDAVTTLAGMGVVVWPMIELEAGARAKESSGASDTCPLTRLFKAAKKLI